MAATILLTVLASSLARASSTVPMVSVGGGNSDVEFYRVDASGNVTLAHELNFSQPYGAAIGPHQAFAYIADYGAGTVDVVDLSSFAVVQAFSAGSLSAGIIGPVISPDGKLLTATCYDADTVLFFSIDPASGLLTQVGHVNLAPGSEPWAIDTSADGSRVYVAEFNASSVAVINTNTHTLVTTIPVGSAPYGVALNLTGTRAYIANSGSNTVSVIDTASNTVVATIAAGIGAAPTSIAVAPNGAHAYVTNYNGSNISVIDTATNTATIVTTAAVPTPGNVVVDPRGGYIYVTCAFDPNLRTFSLDSSGSPTLSGIAAAASAVGLAIPRAPQAAVAAGPEITSSMTAAGQVGMPFAYAVATGLYPPLFLVGGQLPAGLSINHQTGVISGTPTEGGAFLVQLYASGPQDQTATQTLAITIAPGTQTLTAPSVNAFGTAFPTGAGATIPLQASNSSGLPITYTVVSGAGTVSGSNLIVSSPGVVTVQASQAGNATYNAATQTFTVTYEALNALANVSVRGAAAAGQPLTLGFVLSGTGPKNVLVRGIGPALAGFGIFGALSNPVLQVFDGNNQLLASNTGWGGGAALAAAFSTTGAFSLPAMSADSALITSLAPGKYTVQVAGAGGTSGAAMVEIYDLSSNPLLATQQFTNVSTLSNVTPSAPVVAGVSVAGFSGISEVGPQPNPGEPLLIRAAGPALTALGVTGALASPTLSLYAGAIPLQNISLASAIAAATAKVGAFPFASGSADAAILANLAPGNYSVQAGGGSGTVLLELYQVP